MTGPACNAPIALAALIEYWLGELDDTAEARIDEHLLGCGECSKRLAELVGLARGIRAAFREGAVRAFVADAFVKDLAEQGVRLREYRVARNGSVNCTVAPEDDMLVARLEAPLAGVSRLDAIVYPSTDAAAEVFHDIPFNAASGEVVLTPNTARLRLMPSHQHRVRLVAVDAGGERVVGDYTFHHTAFDLRA
ncbi:MAG: zf-HC2 domain-containing protein [Betaproteobacteria bacterium]|nr:zf-HC2 domain-containing protein [Betaproteobacteria bacterium]